MRISFVGAGNVAWHLAQALEHAGHHIVEVYSRDTRNARRLINKLYDTTVALHPDFAESSAELIILAVSDDALDDVMQRLVLPEECILVHTSGTKTLEELTRLVDIYSDVPAHTGVFYPLQTFSRDVPIELTEVPLCIEASDASTESTLIKLAQDLSNVVYLMNSEERAVMHIAAVFACNFTNHLFSISKRILDAEHLEFDLLKPLIRETVRKAMEAPDPTMVQTGPARRGDRQILERHLDYLERYPAWQGLYETLSESIMKK
ncbi:Rossmann-like and DUF2520 domain-containing protein [Runella slithyformis]|uniref:DUF2520 domain-containing protein n=1 Tax=Runella slithyformis (strain ATCC 29530 / DSM 19594 / LMG 11500 / NCIMB 11436 / LSU 4) TaxID=761193 RepID=A0A7U4E6Z6_RUNSL|nr:Rossmann-like and DUF2520 domain-containing protein [Runella slithyformis]AEI49839.1 Domain of unknown function DUF2520-containing protein [Runella slithyformis DSM 19594]